MDLQQLQNMWNEHEKKLDKSLQLNMQLLRKINFDKAGFRMRWLFAIKLAEVVFIVFVLSYLLGFTIKYFSDPKLSIPAVIIDMAIIAYFILDIRILSIIYQLQLKNNNEAITPLQKQTAKLKYLIAASLKYALFLIPFYPLLMILIGKVLGNIDFFSPQHKTYLLSNIVVGVLLLPLVIWLFKELSQKEITRDWVKNILSGSGWHQANDAENFLTEIDEFEKEG